MISWFVRAGSIFASGIRTSILSIASFSPERVVATASDVGSQFGALLTRAVRCISVVIAIL